MHNNRMKHTFMILKNQILKMLKTHKWIILFFTLIALYRIIYYSQIQISLFPDSYAYMNYDFQNFFRGVIQTRTPIYPMVVCLAKIIFPNNFLYCIAITQIVLSYVSLLFFYKTLLEMKIGKKVAIIILLIYACNPTIISWDMCILTESIALSLTVILLYYIVIFLKKPTLYTGILNIVLLFIMIYERPTFLLFYAFFVVLLVLKIFMDNNRKLYFKILAICGVVLVSLLAYSYQFEKQYGIFSITDAMPRQQLYIYMERGYFNFEKEDQFTIDCANAVNTADNPWSSMMIVLEKYGNNYSSKRTSNFIKEHVPLYLKDYAKLFSQTLGTDFASIRAGSGGPLVSIFDNFTYRFPFSNVIIFSLIGVVLGIYKSINRRKMDFLLIGVPVLIITIILSTLYATCGEYARTAIHVLPLYLLLIGLVFSYCRHGKEDSSNNCRF